MKNKLRGIIPAGIGMAGVAVVAFIAWTDTQDKKVLQVERTAQCQPIIAEFDRIQEIRDNKRSRFESLLVMQEEGVIPFDSRVVDYEYRAWMIQETELDHRGDGLIQRMRVLDCPVETSK